MGFPDTRCIAAISALGSLGQHCAQANVRNNYNKDFICDLRDNTAPCSLLLAFSFVSHKQLARAYKSFVFKDL